MKIWKILAAAKDCFPKLRMAQKESPELKKLLKLCFGGNLVFPSIYGAKNLPDTSGIVINGQIMSNVDFGSLGQMSGSLPPQISVHSAHKMLNIKNVYYAVMLKCKDLEGLG